ncbi:MAG: DNA repair protein RecO [Luminiphilus sp.]|nr:DNA repair protein RecO [Luminiphilus sp.]
MTDLQPSWVLGRRSYGDNGLLVEFFAGGDGRCGAVARGVFRRKPGGNLAALLQPFRPLLIKLTGRGELKTLAAVEAPTAGYTLRAESLISGLYLNELLTRVLPRFDPHPALFLQYGEAVQALQQGPPELALRRFELVLLGELGYRIQWSIDESGEPISAAKLYLYEVGRGFVVKTTQDSVHGRPGIPGRVLLGIDDALTTSELLDDEALPFMKSVTRSAVSALTAGRPINSRGILRSLKQPSAHS